MSKISDYKKLDNEKDILKIEKLLEKDLIGYFNLLYFSNEVHKTKYLKDFRKNWSEFCDSFTENYDEKLNMKNIRYISRLEVIEKQKYLKKVFKMTKTKFSFLQNLTDIEIDFYTDLVELYQESIDRLVEFFNKKEELRISINSDELKPFLNNYFPDFDIPSDFLDDEEELDCFDDEEDEKNNELSIRINSDEFRPLLNYYFPDFDIPSDLSDEELMNIIIFEKKITPFQIINFQQREG